ncbi:MAG: NfeD family protein [Nitrospirota bacterium]|nr:NfeD family protein [Nitrospirota bacterium]
MIRLLLLAAMGGLLVYMIFRYQGERQRRAKVLDQLRDQVGKRGIVTETCSRHHGIVRLNGTGYAACTDGESLGPRVMVEVVEVHRFRLLVRKVEGMGHLVDVDDIKHTPRPPRPAPEGPRPEA